MQPPDVVRPVSIGLSPEMLERLDLAVRRERVSRSCLVRELIEAGLDRLEGGLDRLEAEPELPASLPMRIY